ncbi:helix-turn-helix domain-containing protein [Filimonas effusa]|uniref:Helix-turn-helix domain-containing protein n=1 Tax=Filimonas effusa TaxID=2508721 RepID=A0A4Q1D495_9BACT|nr:AraC family transcriptional regulator [Filimonas effusa]RXK83219.1 helix-turn-helix domain-containing protein [Filimonas effusa]
MSKALPTYSIDTLKEQPVAAGGFMADGFAHYLEAHKNLHFPHKHAFYHLVYFSKGSGGHSIDFVGFPVEPGQVYFMAPGQVHSWDFESAPDGFIVNFSESYIPALVADPRYLDQFSIFSGIAREQVITIPEGDRPVFEKLLETIVREGRSTEVFHDDFARTALLQLFIMVSRYTGKADATQLPDAGSLVISNFRKLIEKHYKEKKLTKDYAALLYVTPNYLTALSKDVTGSSAGELIRQRVLLEAKRLLVNARMNVTEIASELDFIDNSYFTKFFKKYEGMTPEAFRKQFIKK